ncbi:tyrosine-type recombinase/integrase [Enterococcus rivorum]
MKYSLLKGYISKNPYELLEMPVNEALKRKKEQKRRKKYYSIEIVQESLQLMKKEHGFQRQQISLSHKLIKNKETGRYERVEGMKNGYRFRDVPINETIVNLLKEWKQKQAIELKQLGIKQTAQQFLFTYVNQKGEVNQPLHTDWLNNKLNQLEKKYELPHIIPHGLRHTFVSDLLNQGIDGLIIKSLVGHAETSNMIRDVYGHTNDQTKIDTIKRLEEYRQAKQE